MAPPKNQPSEPPFTHPSDAWTRAQFGRAADSETQDVSGAEAVNPWVDGSSPSGGATTKPATSNDILIYSNTFQQMVMVPLTVSRSMGIL